MNGTDLYRKTILAMLKIDYKEYDKNYKDAEKFGNLDDCKEYGAITDYIEELIERIKLIK